MRPDLDGVSFMSAMVSSVEAVAIDQVLTAVAAIAEPDDSRNLQQRRADALVDMLLGRISNGCPTRWDTNSDDADGDLDAEDDFCSIPAGEAEDPESEVVDDWDLPASAFRPDPPRDAAGGEIAGPVSAGSPRSTACSAPSAGAGMARAW